MLMSDNIAKLIMQEPTRCKIAAIAQKEGMRTLRTFLKRPAWGHQPGEINRITTN